MPNPLTREISQHPHDNRFKALWECAGHGLSIEASQPFLDAAALYARECGCETSKRDFFSFSPDVETAKYRLSFYYASAVGAKTVMCIGDALNRAQRTPPPEVPDLRGRLFTCAPQVKNGDWASMKLGVIWQGLKDGFFAYSLGASSTQSILAGCGCRLLTFGELPIAFDALNASSLAAPPVTFDVGDFGLQIGHSEQNECLTAAAEFHYLFSRSKTVAFYATVVGATLCCIAADPRVREGAARITDTISQAAENAFRQASQAIDGLRHWAAARSLQAYQRPPTTDLEALVIELDAIAGPFIETQSGANDRAWLTTLWQEISDAAPQAEANPAPLRRLLNSYEELRWKLIDDASSRGEPVDSSLLAASHLNSAAHLRPRECALFAAAVITSYQSVVESLKQKQNLAGYVIGFLRNDWQWIQENSGTSSDQHWQATGCALVDLCCICVLRDTNTGARDLPKILTEKIAGGRPGDAVKHLTEVILGPKVYFDTLSQEQKRHLESLAFSVACQNLMQILHSSDGIHDEIMGRDPKTVAAAVIAWAHAHNSNALAEAVTADPAFEAMQDAATFQAQIDSLTALFSSPVWDLAAKHSARNQ